MTLDEFFAEVEASPRTWVLEDGAIRCPIGSEPGECHCPWSLVKQMVVGIIGSLDMEYREEVAIWRAADNIEGHDPLIRDRLLAACGITPSAGGAQ